MRMVFRMDRISGVAALLGLSLSFAGCVGLSSVADEPTTSDSLKEAIAPRRISPLDVQDVFPTVVQLTWTPTAGAVSYEVHLGADSNPPAVGDTSATTFTIRDLPGCATQYWRVVANLAGGETTSSPTWSFKTRCP